MSRIFKNIIIILIILAIFTILILGQQPYFEKWGKGMYGKLETRGKALWQNIVEYWNKQILHKVTTEIEKRQNIAKQEIKKETKEVTQTIWQKIKNYILGFFSGIFNQAPQENK